MIMPNLFVCQTLNACLVVYVSERCVREWCVCVCVCVCRVGGGGERGVVCMCVGKGRLGVGGGVVLKDYMPLCLAACIRFGCVA